MPRQPKTRRWQKMGVELEGAWDRDYMEVAAAVKGAQGKHDGSVRNLTGYKGEITTRPHTVLDHLCEDVSKLYPDRVNETCGFHIHASFHPLDYSMLADRPFWDFYRARWEAWGTANEAAMDPAGKREFWDRFHGRGDRARRYCKAEFKPEEQLRDHEDRYTQLNFTAYHKYQTLESRMLPMFRDRDLAILAIREMSDIFDSFLCDTTFPPITMEREFKFDGDIAIEEAVIKMPDTSPWEYKARDRVIPAVATGEDITYAIPGAMDLMIPYATQMEEQP